jgi:hypothetical protein
MMEDDPRAPMTAVVAITGAILVFVIVVALQAWFYAAEESEIREKVVNRPPEELSRLRTEQVEQITTYRWIDSGKGVAAIPIDRAMELTIRERGRLPIPASPPGGITGASNQNGPGPAVPGQAAPGAQAP